MNVRGSLCAWVVAAVVVHAIVCAPAMAEREPKDRLRVLITNDNGIDDPKLIALARAFSVRAETWVVAPDRDRSGSGSYLSLPRVGEIAVQSRDLGKGINAFAVDGFPADCVVLAVVGLMEDRPPDVVISGINKGANLGSAWMFSGTVGAARVAAWVGLPAIAISGLDDDLPGAVESAVGWVVELVDTDLVSSMGAGEYLTVSLPRMAPEDIRGIKVTDRAPLSRKILLSSGEGGEKWRVTGMEDLGAAMPPDSDQAAHDDGYIAVVPMKADEVDLERLANWRRTSRALPAWPPQATSQP